MGDEKMQIEVDESLCTGCRLCEERAPENIRMDEGDMAAHVIKQPVGEEEYESCTEAVDYCPTGGLTAVTPEEE